MRENDARLAVIETMCGVTATMAIIATIELACEMTCLALQVNTPRG